MGEGRGLVVGGESVWVKGALRLGVGISVGRGVGEWVLDVWPGM